MPEPASKMAITALAVTIRAFGCAATAASRAIAGSGSQEMTARADAGPGSREMMRAGPRPGSRPMMTRAVAGPGRPSKDERAVVGLLCRPALTMPLPRLWPSPGAAPTRPVSNPQRRDYSE